ncbi:MAG: NADP-dependent oxidoreductase [Myxococcales bacterium]|nr:MAG: NADP-dependent oxidoreductase [Myxococcales bacterium]
MKAQTLKAIGGTDNFELTDVPTPAPGPGQVLVRVAVVGINSLEWKIRNGTLGGPFAPALPAILGKEFAGTVEALGEGATGLAVGDRVAGFADSGVYAQYAVARPASLARLPDDLSFERAATLPVAVETASRGIDELGVQPGWTVVVNGAAGGVGTAAVQLLVKRGVMVIGTASTSNHAYLAGLGAIPVAYGAGVADRIRALAPRGVDAVFDVAGHGFAATAIALTGDPERVLSIADFEAASLGIRVSSGSNTPSAASFAAVLPLAATGEFRTEIDRTYALADIAAAHAQSEAGHTRGKIIVTV